MVTRNSGRYFYQSSKLSAILHPTILPNGHLWSAFIVDCPRRRQRRRRSGGVVHLASRYVAPHNIAFTTALIVHLYEAIIKCKTQLQDGPRLENMCLRLWHREHTHSFPALSDCSSSAGTASYARSDNDSASDHSDSSSEQDEHEHDYWPIDGYRSCLPLSDHRLSCRRSSGASDAPSSRRSSSTASQKPERMFRRCQTASSPGKIMAELIPEKFMPEARKGLVCEKQEWSASTSTLNNQSHIIVGVALTEEPAALRYASPPAIKYDTVESGTKDGRLLPQLHIVNPTPHPTPPMTPQTSAPIAAFSSLKPGQLAVPVSILPLPLTLSTGKSPAPVLPSEASKSSSATHGNYHPTHARSISENIALPLSPPVTATSNGSVESNHHLHHYYHVQAQLPVIDRESSARPESALSPHPRSSDHKFYIVQNGDSPDSHHPDASGSSVVSGGVLSQSSSSHKALRSQGSGSGSRSRSGSHGRRGSGFNGVADGQQSGALVQPSSVNSTRSHATTRSHASTGSSNANRSSVRGTKRGREGLQRPAMRRANTHTTAVLHRQPLHRPKMKRTNSGQSSAQRPAAVLAPLTQLQQQQQSQEANVVSNEVDAASAAPGSSKSGRVKSRSPQKTARKALRLDIDKESSSSSFGSTDSGSWTDEVDQTDEQPQQSQVVPPEDDLEEQRRRSMFAKVDRKSYTELSMKRTQSGLLSSLLRPGPSTIQEGLYRMTRSTQDFTSSAQGRYPIPSAFQAGKSPAAVPVAVAEAAVAQDMQSGSNGRSKLRLKGRPEGEVIESDSEEDDADNTIQMSNSLAVQRLAALHGRRSSNPAAPSAVDERQSEEVAVASGASDSPPPPRANVTAPISMIFPYNLPPPVPPSTPRTTRRRMLSNELSESLRRNLLWERQQSKLRPIRRQSGGNIDNVVVRPLPPSNSASNVLSGKAEPESTTRDSREEERRKALARHRAWAAEYNGAGW